MQYIIRKLLPSELFKNHGASKNSLLALIIPLVAKIVSLANININSLEFDNTTMILIKSLIDNSDLPTGVLDTNMKMVACSRKWLEWYNQTYDKNIANVSEISGCKINELVNPLPKEVELALVKNLKGRYQNYDEICYSVNDSDKKYLKWESVSFLSAVKKPLGILFLCKDVTSKRGLEIKNAQLMQANQMLESFDLVFAHDIMQPMRQLSNFFELLEEQIASLEINNHTITYYLEAIKSSLSQIHNFSEGLAFCSHNENDPIRKEKVSVFEVIKTIQDACLKDKKDILTVNLKEDVIVFANRISVVQLFQNLIINAVKYSTKENPKIVLSGKGLARGFFKFSLSNNGYFLGFDQDLLNDQHLEDHSNGWVGLGLMICKKIIFAHKGKISFKSSIRNGTMVSFTLPTL